MRDADGATWVPEALLERGADLIWRASVDRRFLAVSRSVSHVLGFQPLDLIGHPIAEFIETDPVDLEGWQILRGGGLLYARGRIRRRDGGLIWFENRMVGLLDEHGEFEGYAGVLRDIDEQMATEHALAAAEVRYRLLAENASDVVIEADNDGRIRWISPSVHTVLQRTPAEMTGHLVFDFMHPDDLPLARDAAARARGGAPTQLEVRQRTKDGHYRWMSVMLRPVIDDAGNVVGRVAGWRDIDAERRARVEVEDTAQRMQFLVDNISDVLVYEVEGIPVFVSPTMPALLGWEPDDFLGHPPDDKYHPDDLAAGRALRSRAHEDEGVVRSVMRMRHKDGGYRSVEISAHRVHGPDGRPGAVGLLHDVTERETQRQQIEAANMRDRAFAELGTDMLVIADAAGAIQWISGRTQELLGLSHEQLLGSSGLALFATPPPTPDLPERRTETGDSDYLYSGEVELRHTDGTSRWFLRTGKGLLDAEGTLVGYATAWRDVQAEVEYRNALADSEREAHSLAEQYLAASGEAQAANLAKTTFLSRMSHELRTPLNAVLGFAQLLAMDGLSDEQEQAVQQILHGGRHLLDLINEVLDVARIESGSMSMSPEAVVMADVISETLDLVRPLATQYQVRIAVFEEHSCEVTVFVDRQRTIQILLNLLTNGIKYNRAGGSVSIRCTNSTPTEVTVEVEDDGIGIAEADLPKLFAPFERLGAEVSGIEGTGIGLALSRGLAELMDGRIVVHSTLGVGSVFALVLPRSEVPRAPDLREWPVQLGRHTDVGTSVLYVEDNPTNAQLMQAVATRRGGVRLTIAGRGQDALDAVATAVPDLVLLDLHLPDMAGEEVLRRLRTDVRTATVPVVVLSADAGPGVRSRLLAMGADAFLAKPVDISVLMSWIDDPHQAGHEQ